MKKLEASSIRLTRPELAVLLAYAKVELKRDLAQSSVLDDPFLSGVLVAYFPRLMRQKFRLDIEAHPLRREIISTVLANTVVDRGGPTVLVEIQEKTGHKAPNVACAFMIVNAIYDLDELWARIDALDGRVQAAAQLEIYAIVQSFLRRQVGILVSRLRLEKGLSHYAAILRDGIDAYRVALSGTVAEGRARTIESAAQRFVEFGIPSDLAKAVMTLDTLANGVSIAFLAERTGYQVAQISSVYSHVGEFFSLRSLEDAAWAENASNQFERSNVGAVSALLANVHQSVTECAVRAGAVSMADIIEWFEVCGPLAAVAKLKVEETIVDGRMTLARLSLAAIQVVQLREAIVEGLQYHYAK